MTAFPKSKMTILTLTTLTTKIWLFQKKVVSLRSSLQCKGGLHHQQ